MSKKLPNKINLLSNIDAEPPRPQTPEFQKPDFLIERKKFIDYVDLFSEKAWRIWAVVIGGMIIIWLAWMR